MTVQAPGPGGGPPRLEEVVAAALDVPVEVVTGESSPYTLGSWTSRRHIEVIMRVETVYGVSFSASELVVLTSVDRIRAVLRGKGVPL